MFMLPRDLKEAAALERRRQLEHDRQSRFFNHRNRTIGIDSDALAKQVAERKAREQTEADTNEACEKQRLQDAHCAILLERQIQEEERQKNKEIDHFRLTHQTKETRREFDLYDPNALIKALPGRVSNEDPRCRISSAQKFEGEDLSSRERKCFQQDQMRAWLEQQIMERNTADAQRRAAEATYDQTALNRDERACQLDYQEQEVKRQQLEAAQQYNKAIAEENERKRLLNKNRTELVNKAEIYNQCTSDLLTESKQTLSSFGPGQVVGTAYKGMTTEQRSDIRTFQLKQIEERKLHDEREIRRDNEYNQAANGIAFQGILYDREIERRQRELNEKLLQQNRQLSCEQKVHQHYLDQVVFTNQPKPSYFEQFNKSAR